MRRPTFRDRVDALAAALGVQPPEAALDGPGRSRPAGAEGRGHGAS